MRSAPWRMKPEDGIRTLADLGGRCRKHVRADLATIRSYLQHIRMLTTPEFLLSILGGVLLLFFGEAICHILGLVVFGVFTLGRIRVQTDTDKTLTFPWHGFARDQRGRLVAQMEVAGAHRRVDCHHRVGLLSRLAKRRLPHIAAKSRPQQQRSQLHEIH